MRIILVSMLMVCLSSACVAQQARNRRADAIRDCIRVFHGKLIQLSERFPQLKGIDQIQPKEAFFEFQNGVKSGGKKEEPRYTMPAACFIYLRISDILSVTNRTSTQAERDIPELGISLTWYCVANPDGPSAGDFNAAVEKARGDCLAELAKQLKEEPRTQQTNSPYSEAVVQV